MFETRVVRVLIIAPEPKAKKRYLFNFLYMKVYCVFSLESPHRGDSNENTKYTIFNIKKNHRNYPKSAAMGFFPRDSRRSSKQPR